MKFVVMDDVLKRKKFMKYVQIIEESVRLE